ncbi:MAG TPA: (d)CMP kinase [Desulfonatronum sp.]|mgnify:CR=1 FL=1|nr:(d)CMP kinase [Desulfonatronum sp.]
MDEQPLVVTLDGPAGSGKTTVAKLVAAQLGIAYLDSGAMFRGLAYVLGENSWDWPEKRLQSVLSELSFELVGRSAEAELLLNGRPLGEDIRQENVGMWASHLAKIKLVREHLKAAQQMLGAQRSLVAEGRDMGTVIFPRAKHKFFLEARPEERAKRRFRQLQEMGVAADLLELTENLHLRDEQDRNRALAPLKPAEDAVIVDTTGMNANQVAETIIARVLADGTVAHA